MSSNDTLSGANVLLTRPDGYSDYLSDNVRRLGGFPITLPTIEIRYTTGGLDFDSFLNNDIAVFTSRNAVSVVADFIKQSGLDWPTSLTCAAVGDKTAQSIRDAFGIGDVIVPTDEFGAAALLKLDSMKNLTGKRVIFFDGGGVRSASMVLMLEDRGCASVTHAIVYERMQSRHDTTELVHLLENKQVDFAVLTSVEGATNLVAMLDHELLEKLRNSCMIVYSERIKKYLTMQGFNQIVVTKIASDDAVLESIVEESK